MIRIIGGTAGGRRLRTPTGEHTRPTADRVREALFSSVESATGSMSGLRFLDLYAGSGAVGLEAMSRGAAAVTLVEHDKRAAALIRENARSLGLSAEVLTSSVAGVLRHAPVAAYDFVFIDPPYSLPSEAIVADLAALRANGWLAQGAAVIVERATRSGALGWRDGFVGDRSRRYGETTLWYGHAASPERSG